MNIRASFLTVATSYATSIAALSDSKETQQIVVKKNWSANCRNDFLRADRFALGTLDNGTFLLCGWLLHDLQTLTAKRVKT